MRKSRPTFTRVLATAMTALVAAPWMSAAPTPAPHGTPQGQTQRRPLFRTRIDLIYVTVVVRDKAGNVVRGLTQDDFTLAEDDKPQTITAFSFDEIASTPGTIATAAESSADPVQAILKSNVAQKPATAAAPDAARASATALPGSPADTQRKPGAIDLRNRRLVVLLFDVSTMQPEELTRAIESARRFVNERMTSADLVAVASVGAALRIDQDFTAERETLIRVLDRFGGAEAGGFGENPAAARDEAAEPAEGFSPDESEFNIFNTDRRLQAIEVLADAMAPIQQKKAVIYFSSGIRRTGQDNQVQLRAAIDRASKANVSIYPVDSRGLTAVVPGGEASKASTSSTSMFSGAVVSSQFDRLAASQETLVTLASGTGGRPFLDSNDFGAVYTRVIADTASYYVIGYSSANASRDGRFRRIKLRVNRPGLTVEHRPGYYAEKDFAHGTREDRERQLQDQLLAEISATDLPVWLSTGFFRVAADRFYMPVTLAVPGSQIPFTRASETDRATLDVIGFVRDAQGRPIGRLRDTVKLSVQPSEDVRRKNVQYETGFTLPPGKYTLKVVVRENQTGAIGSFETDVTVPDLRRAPVRISSVVLGTQLQKATGSDLLARDGTKLVPSVTHVVSAQQPLYFYYEVYEPTAGQSGSPRLLTSIGFFRGRQRTYETSLVEVTRLSAPDRKAAVFQFSIPASALKPGLYTCQVNVVDDVAGAFVFPRFPLLVRP